MPPSSNLRGGQKPNSSFGSVDWLSQSSLEGPLHTSRPAAISRGNLPTPTRIEEESSSEELPKAMGMEEGKPSAVSPLPETSTAGLSKEADSTRSPRVRTAFTEKQISTLESSFQHRRYLGPVERRRLAQKMHLSESQIKTWFQNRRMKHKRQLQDSQLNIPFPGAVCTSLAFCPLPSALGSYLQLLHPWASLPGPSALVQPPSSWVPCQVEHASLALTGASSSRQPLVCCLPDPGSQAHMLGPGLSRVPWGLCVPWEAGDAF
ncbi:homeobox protein VENTX [Saccopteryx leptura]|uniref:homeobox protein VENTX n=1 Tax=Saccopteryx leptura TaxID=249018 RepID=UPI00339D0FC3